MTAASKNFTLSQVANVLDITANGAVIGINAANYASNLGPIGNVTITGGSNGQYLQTNGNGTLSWSTVVTNNVANANYSAYTGNVTIAAQPNITSLGTLSGLTSNGTVNFTNASNVSLGAVGNVKITGGSNAQVLTTDGSGSLSWATPAAGGNASYVTGQFAVFAAGPPDNTWLKTGVSYRSNSYPSLATIYAYYTANNSATSTAWGWGNTPSIFYGGGRYIGIETSSGGGVKRTKYSTDGVTWTTGGNLPTLTAGSWSPSIAWNGSVFFVVNYTTGSRIAATSPDGVTWTQRTLPVVVGNSGYYGTAAHGSNLVTVEYNTTGTTSQVAVSSDNGATWTTGTIPFTLANFVASNGTQLVTAKYGGTQSAYSTNGTTWTQGGNLPGSFTWDGAVWNGKFWMMANMTAGSMMAAKSYDGIGWYSVSLPNDIQFRLSWTGKHIMIYFNSGGVMYYSSDPTVAGWQSGLALNRTIGNAFQIAADGTGNSFIVYDTSQDRVYTYTMTIGPTFSVSGGTSPNDWFIKL